MVGVLNGGGLGDSRCVPQGTCAEDRAEARQPHLSQ